MRGIVSNSDFLFTSESVSEGHPDKVADQISDAIVDAHLSGDNNSRIACETLVKNNTVILAGEITSSTQVQYEELTRQVISSIGYNDPELGFDAGSAEILLFINQQSADISVGVNEREEDHKELGAGDQGLMFGFACNETSELMPLPISLSHRLLKELAAVRRSGEVSFLRPDSKAQVTLHYQDGKPVSVDTVVISTQHSEEIDLKNLKDCVMERVIHKVIPNELLTSATKYHVNPTGRFVLGGPVADCGLTGRKIIVDTYGGYSRHGGGAFSGKDPTKVDRSATYAARHIAKNIVAAGLADKCEVQLAYAIGVAQPVSVSAFTFGTAKVDENKISRVIPELFDITPKGIIGSLALNRAIYRPTATYGHFGQEPTTDGHFSWENLNKVEELKNAF